MYINVHVKRAAIMTIPTKYLIFNPIFIQITKYPNILKLSNYIRKRHAQTTDNTQIYYKLILEEFHNFKKG